MKKSIVLFLFVLFTLAGLTYAWWGRWMRMYHRWYGPGYYYNLQYNHLSGSQLENYQKQLFDIKEQMWKLKYELFNVKSYEEAQKIWDKLFKLREQMWKLREKMWWFGYGPMVGWPRMMFGPRW